MKQQPQQWDVIVEDQQSGFGVDPKTGKISEENNLILVKYRKLGSKGRFERFLLIGGMPKDVSVFALVEKYETDRLAGIAEQKSRR